MPAYLRPQESEATNETVTPEDLQELKGNARYEQNLIERIKMVEQGKVRCMCACVL